ncbi:MULTISPECIES: K+/H+ antiporter subunit F [Thioclava]|uniref:K+/H+ antiporter subunit F n=1 Tax=Thioclava nitratireducens TaxID=1915078 RepID=A0ABN4X726_9RHOB|nr:MULTISPECIES: K+/H+ antiporter subunit F [Thioclava]AQS46905.1 K+/H+ antiporter subunit F [Thioclava nitratireducens]OWY00854.1 K+/H+ antiporter subunit F [Thioclava sp. IC9]OWY01241.1 K+/H+ antiporter subunit F [Thioclava sp. F1Mire-8]OWY08541.1 K+/H+ antiporter subunit F [Thioclava sp. F42-5]OWY11703.1 K+/H+ antiporter subunit F [Thioclava sp. F34-6]
MITYALIFAIACYSMALLFNLFRVVKAPGVTDRVLALDTMAINAIAMIVLFGIWEGTALFFEASILYAMTGFVATVSFAKFILRGDIIE